MQYTIHKKRESQICARYGVVEWMWSGRWQHRTTINHNSDFGLVSCACTAWRSPRLLFTIAMPLSLLPVASLCILFIVSTNSLSFLPDFRYFAFISSSELLKSEW